MKGLLTANGTGSKVEICHWPRSCLSQLVALFEAVSVVQEAVQKACASTAQFNCRLIALRQNVYRIIANYNFIC